MFQNKNNIVLNENSVEGKPCINIESKILELTIQLYICYDENESPSSRNTTVYLSWLIHSEDVLGGKVHRRGKVVLSCEHENFGCSNVRKHREIKGSYKYVNFDISLKFDSLERMKITSSESKDNLGRSGKGLVTSLGIKSKVGPH